MLAHDMQDEQIVIKFSSISIATGHGLDNQGIGIRFLAHIRDVSFLHSVQTDSGVHLSNAYRVLFPQGRSGRV
jgi:hypothetical protein